MRKDLLAGIACFAALACREPPPPSAPTPPPATSAADAPRTDPPAPPAAPPAPSPAPASRATALEPGGQAPLSRDGETVVDPASSFEVELAFRAADARLVLMDRTDAHVAATGSRELGATTRLVLAPSAPLVPGSRYVLRVEGAGTRELHDDGGRSYAPLSFSLLAAGTPPPPEPKRNPKRRRR